ncbi:MULTISPECIES: hypothetical protein [Bacillaceae]|uniref:hypothetical protein n=1 Tax=Bacillaceae TaxID=186817 RepID=UPI001C58E557|nr:hypothetical protein [Rossellomorea sp. YZS02]MBW3110777.1 hypothetical protein [Bacillus sp. MCCB 382]MDX8343303.1 hypothetical protein [Rossellomorea sp. YZS02]
MYDHRQLFPGLPGGGSGGGFPGFPGGGQGSGGGFPGIPGFPGGGQGSGGGGFPGMPGFPGGGQGAPSSPPPSGGQGGQNQPPPGPPPNFQPQKTSLQGTQGGPGVFAVDPGAIRRCLFRYTYIWLRRDSFWFYPVFVGRRSIAGWRWIGFTWVYFGIDLDKIESFTCV